MSEEVRPLRAEELDDYINMAAQAFREDPVSAARWRDGSQVEQMRGLFSDGVLQTGLIVHDFQMWYGGVAVAAGGLGAVSSPPENRRQGFINKLLHGVLSELREQNKPICSLYPFYFPFYKRFGWAHNIDMINYTVPMERLPLGRTPGAWHKVYVYANLPNEQPDGGISDETLHSLMNIYEQWSKDRNGMLKRDEQWWRRRTLGIGREKRRDVYYWTDPAGTPRAYVLYRFEQLGDEWSRRMRCEIAALDATALRATLEFIRNHDSQAKEVHFMLPEDIRLLAALDDPRFKTEVEPGTMLRLVDVPAALAARGYPADLDAQFTIAVTDSFLDWNNGTFSVTISNGAATAERTDAAPGVSLDQKTLAQLYSSYLTVQEASTVGLLEAHDQNALAAMGRAFAGTRPFIIDFF